LRPDIHVRVKRARHVLPAVAAALLVAGCGEKQETLGDTTATYAPGVTASPPPWKPEYANLKRRIERLGLPRVGDERHHSHAVIHIYNDGRLIEIPPNIGIDRKSKAYSSVHTHDPAGLIHMESATPHRFTLGDFFVIWGVPFGRESLGNLVNEGDQQVRVYVNGKRVENAPDHVMKDGDNISIGYGTDDSFPHEPDDSALETVSGKGGKQADCSKGGTEDGDRKSCIDEGQ
jgi:hypothetical protein